MPDTSPPPPPPLLRVYPLEFPTNYPRNIAFVRDLKTGKRFLTVAGTLTDGPFDFKLHAHPLVSCPYPADNNVRVEFKLSVEGCPEGWYTPHISPLDASGNVVPGRSARTTEFYHSPDGRYDSNRRLIDPAPMVPVEFAGWVYPAASLRDTGPAR